VIHDEEELDPIRQWEKEVAQLYDYALSNPGKKQGGLLPVSAELASRFQTEAAIDISGFYYVLDADSLRHIHRQQGGASEYSRGQIPIVKQDVLAIHLVMSEPDTIVRSVESHQGLTAIELTKEISGHTF
jgi:hypothetical protein